MTEAELTAIRERNEKRKALKAAATAGPGSRDPQPWRFTEYILGSGQWDVHFVGGNRNPKLARCVNRADAEFFAHARNDPVEADVDALLAEIERLTICDCGLPLSTGGCNVCDNDD